MEDKDVPASPRSVPLSLPHTPTHPDYSLWPILVTMLCCTESPTGVGHLERTGMCRHPTLLSCGPRIKDQGPRMQSLGVPSWEGHRETWALEGVAPLPPAYLAGTGRRYRDGVGEACIVTAGTTNGWCRYEFHIEGAPRGQSHLYRAALSTPGQAHWVVRLSLSPRLGARAAGLGLALPHPRRPPLCRSPCPDPH